MHSSRIAALINQVNALAEELRQRLPLAAATLDLPRGRKRHGWRRDFLAAVREAAGDLEGLSEKQLATPIRSYSARRTKGGAKTK